MKGCRLHNRRHQTSRRNRLETSKEIGTSGEKSSTKSHKPMGRREEVRLYKAVGYFDPTSVELEPTTPRPTQGPRTMTTTTRRLTTTPTTDLLRLLRDAFDLKTIVVVRTLSVGLLSLLKYLRIGV